MHIHVSWGQPVVSTSERRATVVKHAPHAPHSRQHLPQPHPSQCTNSRSSAKVHALQLYRSEDGRLYCTSQPSLAGIHTAAPVRDTANERNATARSGHFTSAAAPTTASTFAPTQHAQHTAPVTATTTADHVQHVQPAPPKHSTSVESSKTAQRAVPTPIRAAKSAAIIRPLEDELMAKVAALKERIAALKRTSDELGQSVQSVDEAGVPVEAPPEPARCLDIVFATAEAAPWSKTGGLGDVMGALPAALAQRGHRVLVVTPRYLSRQRAELYSAAKDTGQRVTLDLHHGGKHEVSFFHLQQDGVDWVFVDHVSYHREGGPYASLSGEPYADNLFRFSLLSLAALEAPLLVKGVSAKRGGEVGPPLGQEVVFVANDWHTSLVPLYLAARFKPHGVYKNARCALALHNMAHQGSFQPADFGRLGLSGGQWYDVMDWVHTGKQPGASSRSINVLKSGIMTCDRLITVSQAYAWEICLGTQGMGLTHLLQQRKSRLVGIVNGVDCKEWDPATDPHIEKKYHAGDLRGKAACKEALQFELKLPMDARIPLLGFIGRLDYQKGPDLVLDALSQLVDLGEQGCQVVMLGCGAPDYEQRMRDEQAARRFSVRGIVAFDIPMSHRVLAACDILLMPSRFEPCGLNQMYAMRYGTVPVAHAAGGLRDTIEDVSPFAAGVGTGWTFSPAEVQPFVEAVSTALQVYDEQPDAWAAIQQAGMSRDFSWARSSSQYERVLGEVLDTPAHWRIE